MNYRDDSRYPQDDETTIYMIDTGNMTLQEIIDRAQDKWGETVSFYRLEIEGREIQVRCFGYDLYDPGDYCQYFVVNYLGEL